MEKRKQKTKKEKHILVNNYLESGLSKTAWCRNNNIPISTFVGWEKQLNKVIKDGRIQLSNNLAEQSIRMFVIGRKNWIFSNTANGAGSSAIIYSVVQTAIVNNLKPEHYLRYVYEQIQLQKDLELENLLPWSEKIPEECKKKTSD